MIDACLDGDFDRVCALVDDITPAHPAYDHFTAIHQAMDAVLHDLPPAEPYQHVRRALSNSASDPDLFLLLLRFGVLLAIRSCRIDQARRMLQRASQVDRDGIRPDVRAMTKHAQASLQDAIADHGRAVQHCHEALQHRNGNLNSFWMNLISFRAHCAICAHDFATAARDLVDIEAHPSLQLRLWTSPLTLKAHLYCESGRVEEGLALLDAARAEEGAIDRKHYVSLCIRLLLKCRKLDEAAVMLDQVAKERLLLTKTVYKTLRAIEALAQGNLAQASDHGRTAISGAPRGMPIDFDMTLRTLAGTELASRRPREARRILKRVDPSESRMPTQMLWARLALLEDRVDRAAEHFQRVASLGPRYVLDTVRDAWEFSSFDLARLQAIVREGDPPLPATETRPPRGAEMANPVLVGQSKSLRSIRAQIRKVAALPTPVLITGETGTGKDIAARLLHAQSPRANEAFVPVNCGALSDTLIESELFGHVKGAFTGADGNRDGLFVAAEHGTIFLDEVHAMSSRLQAALLRVLENGEIRPVGSSEIRETQARVIAATNQAIDGLIQTGQFREDLYYRLAKLHVHMPPLRDRADDVEPLTRHFLKDLFEELALTMTDDLIEALQQYAWPGNVRQLRNEIERMALSAGKSRLLTADLFQRSTEEVSQVFGEWRMDLGDEDQVKIPVPSRRHTLSRRRRLHTLFGQYDRLTRAEVIQLLECSPNTATRDLRILEEEGLIRRIQTSGHLRTSYFVRSDRHE